MLKLRVLPMMILILLLSASMGNLFSETRSKITYTPEQEYLLNIFKERRSVRAYQSTPVPSEHIKKILDAARMAPTAGNQQPWKFLVIQNRTKLDELKKTCIAKTLERLKTQGNLTEEECKRKEEKVTEYFEQCLSAPVYIVVLVDTQSKYPTYNRFDGPLAAGYLMLAARALGYGTVFYTDSIPDEVTKEVLNIPDRFQRVCITPVGVPKEWPKTPSKKNLDEIIVYEKF